MHSISIPDDAYQALLAQAAARDIAVEELVRQAVDRITAAPTPLPLTGKEWRQEFDALNALIRSRADRYPPGFQLDVSREAMYDGCGE